MFSYTQIQSLDYFLTQILGLSAKGMTLMMCFFYPKWHPSTLRRVDVSVYFVQNSFVSSPGELKTLLPLDREEQDEHRFKMRAVDGGGRYCEADIHITVEDINDNPPQFSSDPYTVTVFENTEMGTYVAKLQANDIDTGEEFYSRAQFLHDFVLPQETKSG